MSVWSEKGIPAGGTTGQVLEKDTDQNFDAGWGTPAGGAVWGSITGSLEEQIDLDNTLDLKLQAGASPLVFAPSSPTGTSSASYVMMGLGGTIKITPLRSGKVRFCITGKCAGTGAGMEINIKASYGTGVAPANGAAATGSVVGSIFNDGVLATAGAANPYLKKNVIITGLTPGVQYWFDLQFCRGSAAGTVNFSNVEATLEELPF